MPDDRRANVSEGSGWALTSGFAPTVKRGRAVSTSAVEIALDDPMRGARLTLSGESVSQIVDVESSDIGRCANCHNESAAARRSATLGRSESISRSEERRVGKEDRSLGPGNDAETKGRTKAVGKARE